MKLTETTRSPYENQCIADSLAAKLEAYTPRQLASRLGINKRAVLAAIASGELPAKRINRRVFRVESPDAARWWVGL
jgi:excisionase family DNA binding protein